MAAEGLTLEKSFNDRAKISGVRRGIGGLTLTGLADPAQDSFFVCAEARSDIASPPTDEAEQLTFLASVLNSNCQIAAPEDRAVLEVVAHNDEATLDIQLTAAGFVQMTNMFDVDVIRAA